MQYVIIAIIREIAKVIMFIVLWGFPLWLSRATENYYFLWLLGLSSFFTFVMFAHYEALEYANKDSYNDTDVRKS